MGASAAGIRFERTGRCRGVAGSSWARAMGMKARRKAGEGKGRAAAMTMVESRMMERDELYDVVRSNGLSLELQLSMPRKEPLDELRRVGGPC